MVEATDLILEFAGTRQRQRDHASRCRLRDGAQRLESRFGAAPGADPDRGERAGRGRGRAFRSRRRIGRRGPRDWSRDAAARRRPAFDRHVADERRHGRSGCPHRPDRERRAVESRDRRGSPARTRAAARLVALRWCGRLQPRRRDRLAGAQVRTRRRQHPLDRRGDGGRRFAPCQRGREQRSVLGAARRWRQFWRGHGAGDRPLSGGIALRRLHGLSRRTGG